MTTKQLKDGSGRTEVAVTIGPSVANIKQVHVPQGTYCPEQVDKTNWMSTEKYEDKYTARMTGMALEIQQLVVSRILPPKKKGERVIPGWGMNLIIRCYTNKPVASGQRATTNFTAKKNVWARIDQDIIQDGRKVNKREASRFKRTKYPYVLNSGIAFRSNNDSRLASNNRATIPIGTWLVAVNPKLAVYTKAFTNYGFEDTNDLHAVEAVDLSTAFEAMKTKPLHRVLIMKAFVALHTNTGGARDVRTGKPGVSVGTKMRQAGNARATMRGKGGPITAAERHNYKSVLDLIRSPEAQKVPAGWDRPTLQPTSFTFVTAGRAAAEVKEVAELLAAVTGEVGASVPRASLITQQALRNPKKKNLAVSGGKVAAAAAKKAATTAAKTAAAASKVPVVATAAKAPAVAVASKAPAVVTAAKAQVAVAKEVSTSIPISTKKSEDAGLAEISI
jgi:hypothetical protein